MELSERQWQSTRVHVAVGPILSEDTHLSAERIEISISFYSSTDGILPLFIIKIQSKRNKINNPDNLWDEIFDPIGVETTEALGPDQINQQKFK